MSTVVRPPYEITLLVRDSCLCLYVQRAARALARRFDDVLRPLGLTNGQFSLMMSLNRPEAAGMAAVASLLAMDRTTLTAALKPLQRRGLVKVAADAKDRRGRLLTLTAKGRQLAWCALCRCGSVRIAKLKRSFLMVVRSGYGRICRHFRNPFQRAANHFLFRG